MRIRKYKTSDKEEVMEMVSEILGGIFNGDPRKFKLLKEFSVKNGYLLYIVAEIDGKIVATMALKKEGDSNVRLKRMYVRKEYAGRGIAQKLLNKIIDFARSNGYKKMYLHIYPIMTNANRFLKKNGFVDCEGEDEEQIHAVKILE